VVGKRGHHAEALPLPSAEIDGCQVLAVRRKLLGFVLRARSVTRVSFASGLAVLNLA
jgi:hypothetical protein